MPQLLCLENHLSLAFLLVLPKLQFFWELHHHNLDYHGFCINFRVWRTISPKFGLLWILLELSCLENTCTIIWTGLENHIIIIWTIMNSISATMFGKSLLHNLDCHTFYFSYHVWRKKHFTITWIEVDPASTLTLVGVTFPWNICQQQCTAWKSSLLGPQYITKTSIHLLYPLS